MVKSSCVGQESCVFGILSGLHAVQIVAEAWLLEQLDKELTAENEALSELELHKAESTLASA
eukprot:628048-Amphidinium_carterae.1